MEDYRRKVFVIESIGEFQKEILEGKFIGWEEIFIMCFYGIIYLKFEVEEKEKKFFVLASYSSTPVVGRQAGYCSLRELFLSIYSIRRMQTKMFMN